MRRAAAAAAGLLVLAGCVAPEPPPPVRRAAAPPAPLPAGLEAAPMANRKLSAPKEAPVLSVDGLKKKAETAPPL